MAHLELASGSRPRDLGTPFDRLLDRLQERLARRREGRAASLDRLDDRMLADIGVRRRAAPVRLAADFRRTDGGADGPLEFGSWHPEEG